MSKKLDPHLSITFHTLSKQDWFAYSGTSLNSLIYNHPKYDFIYDLDAGLVSACTDDEEWSVPVQSLSEAQVVVFDMLQDSDKKGWTAVILQGCAV